MCIVQTNLKKAIKEYLSKGFWYYGEYDLEGKQSLVDFVRENSTRAVENILLKPQISQLIVEPNRIDYWIVTENCYDFVVKIPVIKLSSASGELDDELELDAKKVYKLLMKHKEELKK